MKYLIIAILFIGIVLVLVPNILFVALRIISTIFRFRIPYRPFGIVAAGLFLASALTLTYGYGIGRFRYEVRSWEFADASVPEAFNGYRIVHISDIHSGGWIGHERRLQRIIDEISEIGPDLICFTGDLVDISPDEALKLAPVLKTLNAPDGVISVLGNHDYIPYNRSISEGERSQLIEKLTFIERDTLGWILLMNQNAIIRKGGDSIAIIGTENQSMGIHNVVQRGDLPKAMEGTDGMMRILLTHDPTHWHGQVTGKTDIPLTLSGHTHAMQFRIARFTPSRWLFPEYAGLYTDGARQLYVNIGLGGSMPVRIGATPEITVLTLKR